MSTHECLVLCSALQALQAVARMPHQLVHSTEPECAEWSTWWLCRTGSVGEDSAREYVMGRGRSVVASPLDNQGTPGAGSTFGGKAGGGGQGGGWGICDVSCTSVSALALPISLASDRQGCNIHLLRQLSAKAHSCLSLHCQHIVYLLLTCNT